MSAQPYGNGGPMQGSFGGYGSYPQQPMGGQFYGSVQQGDATIDRYVVPGDIAQVPEPIQVQSFTQVMENQTYMEPKQITIKVPRTVMEDVQVSYQVPAMESKFHTAQRPRTVMEEQMITVNEPRTVMEPVAIQVPVVQTTQAVQMHHKIVEYERPRMIPGRMVRAYAGPTQTVGMAQPQMYGSMAQPQMYGSSSFAPMMGGYGAMPGMMNGYPTIVSSQAANTGVYSAPQDNTDAISA